jgi:toxin ParE1/3/4
MKVRYTPRAFADLEAIYNFIHEQNPAASIRVRDTIAKLIDRLATFPAKGQKTDAPNVRGLVAARFPYRIYYRIESDWISILHIRHTARRSVKPGDL